MKKLILAFLSFALVLSIASSAFAAIKWINSYQRKNGSYVSGHWRDTSNDGNSYNNANYLGWND